MNQAKLKTHIFKGIELHMRKLKAHEKRELTLRMTEFLVFFMDTRCHCVKDAPMCHACSKIKGDV